MRKQKAFTLIELMVVMAIIAILATAGISAYSGYTKKARDTSRVEIGRTIESSVLGLMASNNGRAPTPTALKSALENEGIEIKDPAGGGNVCLGDDGITADQPCRFDYVAYDDGSYSISYGVESPDSTKENFFRATFTDTALGATVKVGAYRGDATFIGKGADKDNQYIPVYPVGTNTLMPITGRIDTHAGGIYTLTTALAGINDDITWISSSSGVTITYATPVIAVVTAVSVSGKNITITPGTKTRMIVSGAGSTTVNGTYPYSGFFPGTTNRNMWTKEGVGPIVRIAFPCVPNVCSWIIDVDTVDYYGANVAVYAEAVQPENQSFFKVGTSSINPAPTITKLDSSASQVIAAVASSPAASALITGSLAPGNDGSGSVVAMAQSGLFPN